MVEIQKTIQLWEKQHTPTIQTLLSLPPIHFKIALSRVDPETKEHLFQYFSRWSQAQIEVTFPFFNCKEHYELIALSRPEQAETIRSCLSLNQSNLLLLEGQRELKELITKIKKLNTLYDFKEASKNPIEYLRIINDLDAKKEVFLSKMKQISSLFTLIGSDKDFSKLIQQISSLEDQILSKVEEIKKG